MSSAERGGAGGADAARLSNETNPAQEGRGSETGGLDSRPDVPTPSERIAGILSKFGDRAMVPLSEEHGRTLRADALEDPVESETEVQVGPTDSVEVSDVISRSALSLIDAVEALLEWYEGYRGLELKMSQGDTAHGDYEDFQIPLNNSFSPTYQARQYAQLKALERQLIGGEYEEHEAHEAGEFELPVTVLFGLTSSSMDGDDYRPMVEHDREIREAWSGSSSSVKRTLRYVLEDKLGLDSTDYAWWWQAEPHPGGGDAAGYSHAHPVVIFDAAAISTPGIGLDDVTTNQFWKPVVAKHVDECDGAEWPAHRVTEGEKSAVSAKDARDIEDFASYVGEYIATDPSEDLLERSDEYLMWAASQWASTSQKYSRDRSATAAIDADACEQQYMSDEAFQAYEHGERIVRSDRSGVRYECMECGSHHGIDQSEDSLAKARLVLLESDGSDEDGEGESAPSASTESGSVVDGKDVDERWPSARSVASVGSSTELKECDHTEPNTCPLCATCDHADSERCVLCVDDDEHPTVRTAVSNEVPVPESASAASGESWSEGELRSPTWGPESVVKTYDDEEHLIGEPSGVDYAEIVVEGRDTVMGRTGWDYLPTAEMIEGPEPWSDTDLFDESDVRAGDVPPPEIVGREWGESMDPARRPTAKQWSDDWYAERFERDDDDLDDAEPVSDIDREAILQLARNEGVDSVPAVLGRLGIDPDAADDVAELLEGA